MTISLELSRDHFHSPPPIPTGQVVTRDKSQSGWRVIAPEDKPAERPVPKLPLHRGRSPIYGHRRH
ncbi:MAG: hypothetical protein M1383_05905 [Patescibacteria group bacterium]|nr:hypothetical protein [Patescibacteria group bacterium]